MLKYKTRGMVLPDKKPNVFFCCHPEEQEIYLSEIAEDILKYQNCVLWYTDESGEYNEEDHLIELSEMQLFVMPITRKLLTTKNRAYELEYQFAISNCIPVLPLMQEEGLESLFNERCCDIQFLDKHNRDDTAINFEDKLKKYLEAVLVGDDLAEKIREAFDAYVFLSYRKKDRKYAKELMKLIHKSEFCRDIAIWYDEYLTPGENFNESIRAAFEKSGLFVLAVTPSILESVIDENGGVHKNYVEEYEYPMAREAGVPILPAEIIPTDREELSRKYEGIPECADTGDEVLFSERLLEHVKKFAIAEKRACPEHDFFIGLAYLDGIDVEVDFERAVFLITYAAENGVVEACRKLFDMYSTGKGVKGDIDKAIFWYEKKIEYLRRLAHDGADKECESRYFDEMCFLGDYLMEAGRLSEARKVYEEALEYSEKSRGRLSLPLSEYRLAIAYTKMGDICRSEGQHDSAHRYFCKMNDILAKYSDIPLFSYVFEKGLIVSYERMGSSAENEKNYSLARQYYKKMLHLAKKLNGMEETEYSRSDLAFSYERMGDVEKHFGNIKNAEECYRECYKLSRGLYLEMRTEKAKRNYLLICQRLGGLLADNGDAKAGKEYLSIAYENAKELFSERGTYQSLGDLARATNLLGKLYISCDRYEEARALLEHSVDEMERLRKVTGEEIFSDELSVSYERIGDTYKNTDKEKALCNYQRSYDLAIRDDHHGFAVICEKCGDVFYALEEAEKALCYYKEMMESWLYEYSRMPDAVHAKYLGVSYRNIGKAQLKLKRFNEASENFIKSVEYLEKGGDDCLVGIYLSYSDLHSICVEANDNPKALEYIDLALSAAKKKHYIEKSDLSARELSCIYIDKGNLLVTLDNSGDALECYRAALSIREKLASKKKDAQSYDDLAVIGYFTATVSSDKEKRELLSKSVRIYDMLISAFPNSDRYRKYRKIMSDELKNI